MWHDGECSSREGRYTRVGSLWSCWRRAGSIIARVCREFCPVWYDLVSVIGLLLLIQYG